MQKSFVVTLEEDPVTGDLILPFPDGFLEGLGWICGDTLNFTISGDTVVITNISKNQRIS